MCNQCCRRFGYLVASAIARGGGRALQGLDTSYHPEAFLPSSSAEDKAIRKPGINVVSSISPALDRLRSVHPLVAWAKLVWFKGMVLRSSFICVACLSRETSYSGSLILTGYCRFIYAQHMLVSVGVFESSSLLVFVLYRGIETCARAACFFQLPYSIAWHSPNSQ